MSVGDAIQLALAFMFTIFAAFAMMGGFFSLDRDKPQDAVGLIMLCGICGGLAVLFGALSGQFQ